MRSPRRDRARAAIVVALAWGLASCASQDPPGVTISTVASDLTFGVESSGPVANFDPAAVNDPNAVQGPAELPEQFFDTISGPSFPVSPLDPTDDCPEAPINEFPDHSAPLWLAAETKSPPREGLYRWRRAGKLEQDGLDGAVASVSGFERRLIRDVNVEDDSEVEGGGNNLTYTFEMVQPQLENPALTVITRYRVRSNANSRTVFSPVTDDQVRTGEPDRGLVITEIQTIENRTGNVVKSFSPTVGLLLLPLPVQQGESFQSSAVDPRTRENVQLTAKVIGRERVDACGDLVEGWRVDSTLTRSSGGDTVTRAYSYVVAPQYGNILISEHLKDTTPEAVDDVRFTLGQQDPDGLPPEDRA
jgi:hypothetical protein